MKRQELELKAKEFDSKLKRHPMSSEELQKVLCDFVEALSQPPVSGMLPLNTKHQCFENGHAFYLVCEIDNGRSKYGEHKCSRCGHVEPFQYDYGIW